MRASKNRCKDDEHESRKKTYLFNGWWPNFANAVNVIMDVTLIVSTESFRPQVRTTKVSVGILNALDVRPFADQAKCDIKS